jgi:hypothetical protein
MLQQRLTELTQKSTLVAFLCLSLGACYDFNAEDESVEATQPVATGTRHSISGSVGDGPVISADIVVFAQGGDTLANAVSDFTADYELSVIATPEDYPLSIRSRSGTDLVTGIEPDFELWSAVISEDTATVANLNPFTTIAVELASSMPGGLTAANLNSALNVVVRELNFGLDTLVNPGVMDTAIDVSNVAELVKASEALGETIRRTRDALLAVGRQATGNQVVRVIASDLVDSVLDGQGGLRADSRIAAVFSLVQAQVAVETMTNRLRVNGADAMAPMDAAILAVTGLSSPPSTANVPISGRLLTQARVGLAAAQALDPSAALAQLDEALQSVTAGMLPSAAASLIPSDAAATLDNVLLSAAAGSATTLETVNAVVRNDGQLPDANQAPNISGTPRLVVGEGQAYSFTPTASDPDGDTLSFQVANLPGWASFNGNTGSLSGTPGSADAGRTFSNIVISVSDTQGASAALPAFSIRVDAAAPVNAAPSISGTAPGAVTEGSAYSFTPTANDADGDALLFDIANMPGWASFDTNSGRLFGIPESRDAGMTYSNIVISVSDTQGASAALPAFSIRVDAVAPVNAAPTISGSPGGSVMEGASYSFAPNANDPDGDALSFEISGLPRWASFDRSSGRLYGTPQPGDAGTYSNIVISVSDIEGASDALPAFAITVQQMSTGSATLSWTPPTENDDGTPLTDLAGYRIYWTLQSGSLSDSISLDNPGITTYVVDNLPSGIYEFQMTAVNSAGIESDRSNPAIKTVP